MRPPCSTIGFVICTVLLPSLNSPLVVVATRQNATCLTATGQSAKGLNSGFGWAFAWADGAAASTSASSAAGLADASPQDRHASRARRVASVADSRSSPPRRPSSVRDCPRATDRGPRGARRRCYPPGAAKRALARALPLQRRGPVRREPSRAAAVSARLRREPRRSMAGAGFEPAKAEPTRLQRVPFDRSGTPPGPVSLGAGS